VPCFQQRIHYHRLNWERPQCEPDCGQATRGCR
jgi:hypothetical protein